MASAYQLIKTNKQTNIFLPPTTASAEFSSKERTIHSATGLFDFSTEAKQLFYAP